MSKLWLLLQFAMPSDSIALKAAGTEFNVPAVVMYAVAWQETRNNLNTNVRGPGREQCDTLGCRRVCREIGRMQVNPCITWRHPACSRDSLLTHEGNLRCGAAILRAARDGTATWADAIRRYNGSGPNARRYAKNALEYIGWLKLQEAQ